jgi:ABC-type uncharacterized transport system auxiliary subunit
VRVLAALFFAVIASGCLGAVTNPRSYYVLSGDPATPPPEPMIPALVRVRNMDSDSVYEKFQIVVRRSPYELRYSEQNVWAVKPNHMVSDIIARTLLDTGAFSGVTRGLGDTRPDFVISGDLHAIEIYDSDDLWYAHLSISLRLNRFATGERLWGFSYDQRKHVPTRTFAQAVRALSELLSAAVRQAVVALIDLKIDKSKLPPSQKEVPPKEIPAAEDEVRTEEPIYVPEPTPE